MYMYLSQSCVCNVCIPVRLSDRIENMGVWLSCTTLLAAAIQQCRACAGTPLFEDACRRFTIRSIALQEFSSRLFFVW